MGGQAIERGFPELLPTCDLRWGRQVMEGTGGTYEGVAEGVVIEDAVQVGSEDATGGAYAAVLPA